ncbi:Nucleoporin nup45 [Neolecta irregularis DAH-3]|uniref:Nucleoporin nup45 n=1 Tax=Neolecta irregularis (strain DAH-3) TaxID=1198029 RepID=A0A1U7LTT1_NEOID|nr:Nucleoporin nup45 [Neolecta irregularis DAH-3]|eukprot:OLL26085.1 Nucleoporin nup45 [Neolecta irregularis DAH-3]
MFKSTFGQQSQNKPAFSFDPSTNTNFNAQQQPQPTASTSTSAAAIVKISKLYTYTFSGTSQVSQQIISRTTRVSDLSLDVQNQFEELNKYVLSQIQTCEELIARAPAIDEIVSSVLHDIEEVERVCIRLLRMKLLQTKQKLSAITAAINTDMSSINRIRETVDMDIEAIRLSTRVVDAIKIPGTVLPRSSSDPIIQYFHTAADGFMSNMHIYAESLGEIEKHLDALERNGGTGTASQLLLKTLQDVNAVFMGYANKVAELHDQVKKLQVTEGISHK